MKQDRETIGLTQDAQGAIAEITDTGWFGEAQDIARFGLAYAIRAGEEPADEVGTDTRWSAGNFDSTGEIRALLSVLYPDCATPVRLMEHLVNVGILAVAARFRSSAVTPSDLIG